MTIRKIHTVWRQSLAPEKTIKSNPTRRKNSRIEKDCEKAATPKKGRERSPFKDSLIRRVDRAVQVFKLPKL